MYKIVSFVHRQAFVYNKLQENLVYCQNIDSPKISAQLTLSPTYIFFPCNLINLTFVLLNFWQTFLNISGF